ncbi:hypothetical protein [Chitinophaga sp. RAB17]|uniref:hypothetical protein n=1 Tax=Chitinophaga sp. RAB17 TaxID=3233049 RepID=UPI003F8E8575
MSKEQPEKTPMNEDPSQKYRKFLIEVIYRGASYYTIWGTDDNDIDKFIVDRNEKLLLFSNPDDVFQVVLSTDHFFDIKSLQAWAGERDCIENPDSVVDLDVLSMRNIPATATDLLESVYHTVGLVQDYALQVNNDELIDLFNSDIVRFHYDVFANYFIWSPQVAFEFTSLPDTYTDTLNGMYRILEACIVIDSLELNPL